MKGQLIDIVLLLCTYVQVTYSRPLQINNFYQFWKTVDKQSIPQTKALQKLLSLTIESFCATDEILESIPINVPCDDYIQTLSTELSLPVTDAKHKNNPDKFMKALVKNTVKNLNVYVELVQLLAEEYNKSGEKCQDEICIRLNSLSSNLRKLTLSIAIKTKQYFHIKNVKNQAGKALSIKQKSQVEKVAILYGLFTQLKEAESALEFIVKSTWDVHIRQLTNFKKNKKRRELARKGLNLGL